MKPQAYQPGEMRDENDNIIRAGSWGKKMAFASSENNGILDYIINNFDVHERKLTALGVSTDEAGNVTLSPFVEEQMITIKTEAETARDQAQVYKTETETARNQAQVYKTEAEIARDQAQVYKTAAEAAKDLAVATTPDGFAAVAAASLEFSRLGLSVDEGGFIIQTIEVEE